MKVRQLTFVLISLNLFTIYSLDATAIVLAINAGGSAYTSSLGFTYSGDMYYQSGSNAGGVPGITIDHTVDESIYKTERWGYNTWGYSLPINTDGEYVLILQFAEIFIPFTNGRVFTIQIGSYIAAANLDIFATVGINTAYEIYIPFTLSSGVVSIAEDTIPGAYSNGNLELLFYTVIQNPKISGLILLNGDCDMADYCNMCHQEKCFDCDPATVTCRTCITNASTVNGVCQCIDGAYWIASSKTCELCDNLCISCSSDNFICGTCSNTSVRVSNVCLRDCPYGFGVSCTLISTAVIDQNFADYFYGIYGLFQTGISSTSYYFFNYPETIDPIPAKSRGLHFSGGKYLQTTSYVYISFEFSIGMWVWILSGSGDILTNSPGNKITISENGAMTIILEDKTETTIPIITTALNPSNTDWVYISFIISFLSSAAFTTIVPYLNNSPQLYSTYDGYIYRDATSNTIIIGKSASTNFWGFIYQFTLWNVAVSSFNSQYSDQICDIGSVAICLWTCPLSQWMNGATPINCNSCTNGCVRSTSCNVCYDRLCSICTGFLAGLCTHCVPNASGSPCVCNDGYYLDSAIDNCISCDSSCKTCTSSSSGDCLACASGFYMHLGWCISKCPDGYIAKGSVCLEKDTFIFYLSFDTLEGVIFDKKSKIPALTGNSTAFYPDYDEFDPLAAPYRGFYFNGVNSIMHLPIYSNYNYPVLSFDYSFTFSIWMNIENGFGTIISKQNKLNQPIFSLKLSSGVINISLNFKSSGIKYFSYFQNLEFYQWNHITLIAEYTNLKETKLSFYLNGVINSQADVGSDYFKDTKTDITFILGAEKGSLDYSNYFKGFIYDIKGYNSVKSISSLVLPVGQCSENCNACLIDGTCIPNCLISQYWIGPQYNKCSKCSSGCLSCKDSSRLCNLCNNPKCESCNDFTADTCLECSSGTSNITNCQCDYGLAWNSTSEMCEACHQWQFKADDTCYDCPSLCAQCDNENKCTWCITNAELKSGSCICSPGYVGTTSCTYIPFNVSLSVDKNNTLFLTFSDILKQDLRNDQIVIKIHNETILSWSISQISSKEYSIACSFNGGVSKGTIITVFFINSTSIVSISGGVILEESLSSSLISSVMTSEEQEVAQIQKETSFGAKALVGSSIALAMFNPNPSALWTVLNTIQFLSYIPYASYPLSDKISAFFKSMNDFNFVPNLFLLFIDETQSNPPYNRAKNYGYDSYLILVNIGNDITILCAIIAIFPLVYYFSNCSQRSVGKKLKKILRDYKFGFFLRFLIINYLEIGFASIVGILSTEKYEILENSLMFTNYFLCWFFITLMVITPFLHAYFSYKNLSKIINRNNKKWFATWNSLYYEFKNNKGFMSTQFYVLYFVRRLIFVTVQIFLNDFPQIQIVINAVSSFCIVLFLIFYRPFDNFFIQVTNLITEFGIFIILAFLSLYFFDLENSSINIIDNLIIYFTLFLMLVQTTGPLINSFKGAYYIVKRITNKDIKINPEEISKNESIETINTSIISTEAPIQPTRRSQKKNYVSIITN